ncbi:hypothetical protein Agub_g1168, partial [Astrephomene gubernaculifera]
MVNTFNTSRHTSSPTLQTRRPGHRGLSPNIRPWSFTSQGPPQQFDTNLQQPQQPRTNTSLLPTSKRRSRTLVTPNALPTPGDSSTSDDSSSSSSLRRRPSKRDPDSTSPADAAPLGFWSSPPSSFPPSKTSAPTPSPATASTPRGAAAASDDDDNYDGSGDVHVDYSFLDGDAADGADGGSNNGSGGGGVRSSSLAALAANLPYISDTNALQTALSAAIASEDFPLAAAVRDRLQLVLAAAAAAATTTTSPSGGRIDWAATGLPDWLADRAARLGFAFPTEVQRRSAPVLLAGADAVVGSETGSGKTLAFLLPLLARLSYPPDIFLDDMKGPQALLLVPSLELGVQAALLAFRLLGGNISSGRPGDRANMFTYRGPRGVKVRGVLNKEEVVMAKSSLTYLSQVHLVVGTPAAVMEAVRGPQPVQLLKHLKVLAVDEVDECFRCWPEDMQQLMEAAAGRGAEQEGGNSFGRKPQVVLVGATQQPEVLQTALERGWMREPVNIQVGRQGSVPSLLEHRYVVVPPARRLAALTARLRADLAAADPDAPPARVIVFANQPAEVAAMAQPLRSSLWGEHSMAMLVPPGTVLGPNADDGEEEENDATSSSSQPDFSSSRWSSSSSSRGAAGGGAAGGEESWAVAAGPSGSSSGSAGDASSSAVEEMFAYNPIRALHAFRDHKVSLLLASGAAARGLDLPAVAAVVNLGAPPDATAYLHRAGRAGRIGSLAGGVVTSIIAPEEEELLLDLGAQLGIELVREEETAGLLGQLPRLQAPE